jgi:hypothetical protein
MVAIVGFSRRQCIGVIGPRISHRRLQRIEPPEAGRVSPTFCTTLCCLAGYRHERVRDAEVTARPSGLTLQEVTSSIGPPILVLPKIFHMLWRRKLQADLSRSRLSLGTRLYPGSPG